MSGKDLFNPEGDLIDQMGGDAVAEDGPVECLGKTFANDTERREYYLGLLAEKLKDPEFREIEGFPIGEDEDILNLSDPPYYTACPNPFIDEFVDHYGRPYDPGDGYKCEPYAANVSDGKTHPIYNVHSYHTKVPHKAIMRYILHYTKPGDVVLDGFCGTGMTGVAADLCGDKKSVESLGYKVMSNGEILAEENNPVTGDQEWVPISQLGKRLVILKELSPAATFIASNYNQLGRFSELEGEALKFIQTVVDECEWMYKTRHSTGEEALINCTVWSDVLVCPECGEDIIYWDSAKDEIGGKIKDQFDCSSCKSSLNKRLAKTKKIKKYDELLGKAVDIYQQVPVLIVYEYAGKRYKKKPDSVDIELLAKIENLQISDDCPHDRMMHAPDDVERWGDRWRAGTASFTHVHHLFTRRSLLILDRVRELTKDSPQLMFILTGILNRSTKMNRIHIKNFFHGGGGWNAGYLKGAIYIPSIPVEASIFEQLKDRLSSIRRAIKEATIHSKNIVSTQSSTVSSIPSNSLDYIFVDPPFGANLNYSELNFLWESWLKVWTNRDYEAVESKALARGVEEYKVLLELFFKEGYRALKPGRWLTVEFSNTNAGIWNNIQEALANSGFIVANVSSLSKKQGSFNAVVTTTSVKQDLVISAYKPNGGFEGRFVNESDEDGVWDFIRTHLGYLPAVKRDGDQLIKIPERDPRILFDQVVSYFVRNMRDVPVSSRSFQDGLSERFSERDGMFFLPEQVVEYDKARFTSKQLKQLTIFVDDEASAIEWLRQLLNEKPLGYQDIHPKFINELSGWKKSEEQLELSTLLEQNFIKYDGSAPLPPQIHSYLSTNFKEFRKLKKEDAQLIKKAKDRWYVPNPEREEDLQKLRERSLLTEFSDYKTHAGKKLKKVRMEAVRCGFKKAWQERDYPTIISVAEKIPQALLQEDQKLLIWYDQALTRSSDESLF